MTEFDGGAATQPVGAAGFRSALNPGQFLFAILPVVSGGTIPVFGSVNLVWGSLFGLAGGALHWTGISHPLWADLLCILLWPVLAIFFLGRLGRFVWQLPTPAKAACLAVFAGSFVIIAPADALVTAPWGSGYLPLYVALLDY
jgi:hypothetical protein